MNSAFINSIKEYGNHSNPQIRLNFAQNVHLIVNLIDRQRFEFLMEVVLRLITSDPDNGVRVALANNMVLLSEKMKPKDIEKYILNIYKELLKEGNDELVIIVMNHLNSILNFQNKEDNEEDPEEADNIF